MRRNLIFILAALLAATGCIYDFSAELPDSDRRVVIEGDLMLGQVSTVNISYVTAIGNQGGRYVQKFGSAWVLAEDGTRYEGVNLTGTHGNFSIDLRTAPDDTRYQLHVINADTGREYATDWLEVNRAAVIDELSYIPEEAKDRMAVGISLHSAGQRYFRWSYDEIWEYHSLYQTRYFYTPNNKLPKEERAQYPNGRVSLFDNGENTYYCWGRRKSSEIMIFTTKEQTEDRFVDLEFRTIPRSDARLSMLYYIKVYVNTLSEDAYNYWKNIQTNSDYNGSLFAPNPSEMVGNIHCVSDAGEQVLGFINVSRTAVAELFIDNDETHFYRSEEKIDYVPETCENEAHWPILYGQGKLPLELVSSYPRQYSWINRSCVDCRVAGGTKDKPDFWPNDHK